MSARFPARIAAVTVGVVAGFSIIATSFVDRVKLNPHETFDGSISDAEFLYEFERLLIADDISIDHRHVTDTGYLYDISLGHRTRISHRGRNWQGNRSIDGTICVRRGVSSGLWTISEINFTAYNRELDGYTLTARIRKNVIQPLEEKYK